MQASGFQTRHLSDGGQAFGVGVSPFGFASVFRLGVRHMAEGKDHLLFLLVLLLPAPLIIRGSRWAGFAGVRSRVFRILTELS